jgi:hypothetical protein
MYFDYVAAFFAHIKHVYVSIFPIEVDGFDFIHGFFFNEANVNFLEVLAEVFVRNEKDSVVSGKRYFRTV